MERRNPDIQRRSRCLREGPAGSGPVVYWMSRDQRLADNWALLRAAEEAVLRNRALLIVFCLIPDYPGANRRHYGFLLRGLAQLQTMGRRRNLGFQLLDGSPVTMLPPLLKQLDAHSLVTDFDPLHLKKGWREQLRQQLELTFWEVDTHNIIPAWIVSDKKEYGAYTIRPKIHRLLDQYLTEFPPLPPLNRTPPPVQPLEPERVLATITDQSVDEVSWCLPGEKAADKAMRLALRERLPGYARNRNDPCQPGQSDLSPYLHFGQLAPQRLALEVRQAELSSDDREAFLEELIVRRELADNYCYYEPHYDGFEGFPEWARKTLEHHRRDPREHLYTPGQWERAQTHDLLWNSCQRNLAATGKLHGYLRMYWAKKLLEWSDSPETALQTAIALNDRYSLDGRDPNGYTGIAWSIGGVHDRAWKERPVFGKIRYMNERGCRRKFEVDRYIDTAA